VLLAFEGDSAVLATPLSQNSAVLRLSSKDGKLWGACDTMESKLHVTCEAAESKLCGTPEPFISILLCLRSQL